MLSAAMLHGAKSSLSYCKTCLFIMQKGIFEYVKSYLCNAVDGVLRKAESVFTEIMQ